MSMPNDPADAPPESPQSEPVTKVKGCDFCAAQEPTVFFPQKYGFTMLMPDGSMHRFEDPWNACPACAVLVEKKQLHMLLDRVTKKHPMYFEMNRPQRRFQRAALKKMYQAMYRSLLGKPVPLEAQMTVGYHAYPVDDRYWMIPEGGIFGDTCTYADLTTMQECEYAAAEWFTDDRVVRVYIRESIQERPGAPWTMGKIVKVIDRDGAQ